MAHPRRASFGSLPFASLSEFSVVVRDVVTGPGKVAAWRDRIGDDQYSKNHPPDTTYKRKGKALATAAGLTGTIGAGLAVFFADRARRLASCELGPPGPARPGAGATAAGKTAASNTNHRLQNSPAGLTIHRDLETKETAVRP